MDIIKIRFADEVEGLGSRVEQTIMGLGMVMTTPS